MKIRTFIAIELNEVNKISLKELQLKLKKVTSDVRWVKPEQIHLTLKFLGDVLLEDITNIKTELKKICSLIAPFNFFLTELGVFPDLRRPRILWIKAQDDDNRINLTAQSIAQVVSLPGFPQEEKILKPHLTLGRIKFNKESAALKNYIENYKAVPMPQAVEYITLFRSTLTSAGPVYEGLATIPLGINHHAPR